jgi:hypothetical protein
MGKALTIQTVKYEIWKRNISLFFLFVIVVRRFGISCGTMASFLFSLAFQNLCLTGILFVAIKFYPFLFHKNPEEWI